MQLITIAGVTPGPILQFDGIDPATGEPLRTTIYSGHVGLVRNREFRGMVRATDLHACSFFLPDSAPYDEAPAVLHLETSLRTICTLGNPNLVFFGTHNAQVTVVPDPRENGHQWLQVTFQAPAASFEAVEINYRVTVQDR